MLINTLQQLLRRTLVLLSFIQQYKNISIIYYFLKYIKLYVLLLTKSFVVQECDARADAIPTSAR